MASHATDTPAFGALVEEYAPRVYSLALMVTGSGELAAETTEAVFRDIALGLVDLQDPNTAGRTVMTRVAHHHAVRRARAQSAKSRDAETPNGWPSYPSPLLGPLTAEQAAALEVTYFQGRTLRQAASILDQPVPVLVALIRSGLEAIRRTSGDRRAKMAPAPVPVQRMR